MREGSLTMTLDLDLESGSRLRLAKVELADGEELYLEILDTTQYIRAGQLCQAGPVQVRVEYEVAEPPICIADGAGSYRPYGRAFMLEILP